LTIPIRQLQCVSKKRYIDGFIVHPFVGMIGGVLIGVSSPSTDDSKRGDAGLLTGTAIGIAGGLTLGIFLPPKTVYEFSQVQEKR
jgi:hypothetical protein